MISAPPLLLVLGPEGHGVTRYGDDVARAVGALRPGARTVRVADVAAGDRALGLTVPSLSSFGLDGAGRIYVTSIDGGVFRLAPA